MDILSMLKSAQSDYNSRQQTTNVANNSVASFFTSCGANTSATTTTMPIQIQNMTLESIERRAAVRNSPPNHDTQNNNNNNLSQLIPSHQNQNDLANSPLAQFLNASNVNAARKKEVIHQNGNSNAVLVNGNKTAPPGFLPHPPNGNGNGNSTKLITPAMLATTTSSSIHNNNNNMNGGEKKQSEPLNRYQLVQALKYLIENDDEFTQKVHEAYLKSMKSS